MSFIMMPKLYLDNSSFSDDPPHLDAIDYSKSANEVLS